jgi:Phospholipase B
MRISALFLAFAALACAGSPLFNSSSDADWKKWTAARGSAQLDPAITHEHRQALRLDPAPGGDAYVRSAPVSLRIGKHYELSAWVRTDGLVVRDTDRSPIATGAAVSMASMPFDVHSESLAGTRDWTRLKLRFTATRSEDQVTLSAGNGGAFSGKAWFDSVSIEEMSSAGEWPARAAVKTLGPAYRYPQGGWIYLHIEGKPYERGYQHGYLLANEIERYIDRCAAELDSKSRLNAWQNGRTAADALFLRGFDAEILEEMKGIADGAAAAGAKYEGRALDLIDIVAANTITELGELNQAVRMTPTGLEGLGLIVPDYARSKRDVAVTDRCSAFAATGKATRDGHMVIAHTTWWPLTLAEQTNIMLDVQPVKGHRVLMQAYPGGIQSGTDWYQNDAGVVLTETTIRQSPFNRDGTPVAFRARKAIQYGDNVDKVVEHLSTKNNGLYTNEWLIGDAKNDEIAMFELGTHTTKLWRSSKNEWFAGTEGFYWGCNNAKDMGVRLEYVPDPKGVPENLSFVPAPRDIKWQEMYRQYKGNIDEQFAYLAFRSAPLVSASAMDAKIATAEMASHLMVWAAIGKPNQREWVTPKWNQYAGNDGLYPAGYRLFSAVPTDTLRAAVVEAEQARLSNKSEPKPELEHSKKIDNDRLWNGWILPASDADLWLTASSATYRRLLSGGASRRGPESLEALRVQFRGAALSGDVPLTKVVAASDSSHWSHIVNAKGTLLLDALRGEMSDDKFFPMMKRWFEANTTKKVTTASFREAAQNAAGKPLGDFFDRWLNRTGLPGDDGGPLYIAPDMISRAGSMMIVYGTQQDAGANRYAAERFQNEALNWFESAAPIRKDFELTDEDLRTHDVVFIGRPESNSALAAIASRIGLEYNGGMFRIDGADHASEYDSLQLAATNPLDAKHMVLVVAGNSALETVKVGAAGVAKSQYAVYRSGKETGAGVLGKQ